MLKFKQELINDIPFTTTYSDENRYVVREKIPYVTASDPTELGRQYTEGDEIPEELRIVIEE